jgi:hypothetical protein
VLKSWVSVFDEVVTFTVTLCVTLPPVPVQVSVYVVFDDGVTDWVPEVDFVPVQPPEAVQEEAFVDDHVSVDD